MPPCGAALRLDDAVAAVEVRVPVAAVASRDAAVVVAIAMTAWAVNADCDQIVCDDVDNQSYCPCPALCLRGRPSESSGRVPCGLMISSKKARCCFRMTTLQQDVEYEIVDCRR
jgi:hypothetical protein